MSDSLKFWSTWGGGPKPTEVALQTIDNNLLPFADHGFRFKSIDVFWYGMSSRPQATANAESDDSTDLQELCPPDGGGLLLLRPYHMGILLEASTSERDRTGLFVAVELMSDGIHLKFDFGWMGTKESLIQRVGPREYDRKVYSAGVRRNIDMELSELRHLIEELRTREYDWATFNCQHFASNSFKNLTNEDLCEQLRVRWSNDWGRVRGRSGDVLGWAESYETLRNNLRAVNDEPSLFFYVPGGLSVGTLLAVAGASLLNPLAGIAMFGVGYVRDNIHTTERLDRTIIWFKHVPEDNAWYWSPYRDREVDNDHRWIPVSSPEVTHGRFQGQSIKYTPRRMVQTLAEHNPYPMDQFLVVDSYYDVPSFFQ